MLQAHRQGGYRVRFDWGLEGANAIIRSDCVAVIVDILSFSTTLSVAADHGVTVYPYRWKDATAEGFARAHDAVLAVGRSRAQGSTISLSPMTLRSHPAPPPRLVLPSPNGSTIAQHVTGPSVQCVGASLRNADVVSSWIDAHAGGATVAVIAAGERWPNGALRACVEDVWGAGAVLAALMRRGWIGFSPEARFAAAAYEAVRGSESDALRACASGTELIERGYGGDVDVAAEVNRSARVPRLQDGLFIPDQQ